MTSQSTPKLGHQSEMLVVLTIDVHPWDTADDIRACCAVLSARRLKATFFISTSILQKEDRHSALLALASQGHELGTHSHDHNHTEIRALQDERSGDLSFLSESTRCFTRFYGFQPKMFRSPVWCGLSSRARDVLCDLGYKIDCSSTPQRLGVLSAQLTRNPWLFSRRSPHLLQGSLLEIPSSCFLVPLASPTIHTFRGVGSRCFLACFELESRLFHHRVITVTFDTPDFNPDRPKPLKGTFNWSELLPRVDGGFYFRWRMRETNPDRITRLTLSILEQLATHKISTLREIQSRFFEVSPLANRRLGHPG